MAELFGGKWVFFVAVLMNIVPTLLSPVCSYAGFQYLIVMRIIEGLGGGLTFPAMNVLISKWAPKEERSTISAICYGGERDPRNEAALSFTRWSRRRAFCLRQHCMLTAALKKVVPGSSKGFSQCCLSISLYSVCPSVCLSRYGCSNCCTDRPQTWSADATFHVPLKLCT